RGETGFLVGEKFSRNSGKGHVLINAAAHQVLPLKAGTRQILGFCFLNMALPIPADPLKPVAGSVLSLVNAIFGSRHALPLCPFRFELPRPAALLAILARNF